MIIRPSFTVLGGATIGLVAGVAVYGAISTASAATSTSVKPAKAIVAAPAAAASCAVGQKLEDGVCVIHIERTVVVAAPSTGATQAGGSSAAASTPKSIGQSASGDHEAEVGDHDADDATEGAEDATEQGGSDPSGPDQGAGEAHSNDDSSHAPNS